MQNQSRVLILHGRAFVERWSDRTQNPNGVTALDEPAGFFEANLLAAPSARSLGVDDVHD
jgi:hypothetical protein